MSAALELAQRAVATARGDALAHAVSERSLMLRFADGRAKPALDAYGLPADAGDVDRRRRGGAGDRAGRACGAGVDELRFGRGAPGVRAAGGGVRGGGGGRLEGRRSSRVWGGLGERRP